jgi:molybdenum cofactor cytidylyltransferase
MNESRKNFQGLLISAGLSGRMGKFKPLLTYRNKFFITAIIEKLSLVCDRITVVTGHEKTKLVNETKKYFSKNDKAILSKIEFVYNPDYKKGMFTSLKKGLETKIESQWILYHFIDQPNIPSSFYSEFIKQVDKAYDWIQPAYKSQKGHPIIFNEMVTEKIIQSSVDDNLRNVVIRHNFKKKIWNCDYPQVLVDIDNQEEYNKIK